MAVSLLQTPVQLPDDPNKKLVERLCSRCHSLNVLPTPRRTRSEWFKTIDEMERRGLKASDEELGAVVEYLAHYFGKININRASAEDLASVLDIAAKDAEMLVKYRDENGDFKTIDAVAKVPGVDAARLESRKDRMTLK